MVSTMKYTYETSETSPLLEDAFYETPLYRNLPNPYGNTQLRHCDEAGEKDPTVGIYITPQGDFNISEPYPYGTPEQKVLSHTIGGLIVDHLPLNESPPAIASSDNIYQIQKGVAA